VIPNCQKVYETNSCKKLTREILLLFRKYLIKIAASYTLYEQHKGFWKDTLFAKPKSIFHLLIRSAICLRDCGKKEVDPAAYMSGVQSSKEDILSDSKTEDLFLTADEPMAIMMDVTQVLSNS